MAGLAGCVRILVVEQLREPLGVFWSFVAPIGYIVASATIHGTPRILAEAYLDQAAWGLAYVALMVACNGFGLYLVGRRESGFVRSFLSSPSRRYRFMAVQYLASLVMAIACGTAFLAVSSLALTDIGLLPLAGLLARYVMTVGVFMFAATFFAALPLTFQSAGSVMTVFLTIAVVAGLVSQSPGAVVNPWVLDLNPFAVAARFMSASIPQEVRVPLLATHGVALTILGLYGVLRLRVNPEWSNR